MPTRMSLSVLLAVVMLLSVVVRADAQTDSWTFVVTPQVWVSHIAKNGFVSANGNVGGAGGGILEEGTFFFNQFPGESSHPVHLFDPQWGLQIAAQHGRWSFAGSFQYVTFETETDVVYRPTGGLPRLPVCFDVACVDPGQRVAKELVDTTRLDMDVAASYLFPHVIPGWLDLTLGGGLKVIYATASREYRDQSPFAAAVGGDLRGLYAVCTRDDCPEVSPRNRVHANSWLYGATIPMSAILHLTDDARWHLVTRLSPFIGAETRDDENVLYQVAANSYPNFTIFSDFRVKRVDGTTFAYGATADVLVSFVVTDMLSTYAGARVQYIRGHNEYLAYGPLFGVSLRFGGN